MSALRPCPSCRRHVRSESSCPFCATTSSASPFDTSAFAKGAIGATVLTAAALSLVSYDAAPTQAQLEDEQPVRLTPQYGAPSDWPPPPPPREDVDAGKPRP